MHAHIVLAHPEPNSFNAHLATVAKRVLADAGHSARITDLYASGIDPVEGPQHYTTRRNDTRFDAQTEQRFHWEHGSTPQQIRHEAEALLRADLLILQFPLWWFGPPAILKGWMDRVFVYGGLYKSSMRYEKGACRGTRALVCVTTGASGVACNYNGFEGETRLFLWPVLFSLQYLGMAVLEPFLIHGVRGGLTGDEAAAQDVRLAEATSAYARLLRNVDTATSIPFNADADFDAAGTLRPEAPVHHPFIRHHANWRDE